ncbi:MAG: hypothetical protein OCD02_02175 [Spirochaetaceae bacterium]
MIWVYRTAPHGFEELSLAEMLSAGLKQNSNRYFSGDTFDLSGSAYASFSVKEVSRGESAEDAIKNFDQDIPSPYRMEKVSRKRRRGSLTYAALAEEIHGGVVRASNPASIILVFTPDEKVWIAGFLTEKKNSILDQMSLITQRTSVSLTSQAALAMVNIVGDQTIVDPCCGTGLIPLAAMLRNKKTYMADNNYNMLRKARINRDNLNLDIKIQKKDAFDPWIKDCCLVSDFPADRSWDTTVVDLSLRLFEAWIPYIKSFCVIFPDQILKKLPDSIIVTKEIKFSAGRTIIMGRVKS